MSSRKHKNFLDDSLISTQGNSISIEDSNFLNDQIIKKISPNSVLRSMEILNEKINGWISIIF